jgi:hypothetical protein
MSKFMPDQLSKYWSDWKRKRAMGDLERILAECLTLADGHRSNGVKAGDPCFISLWNKADREINLFTAQWGVDKADVLVQVPGLKLLESLTKEDIKDRPAVKMSAITLIVVIVTLVLGALAGIFSVAHNLVVKMLG